MPGPSRPPSAPDLAPADRAAPIAAVLAAALLAGFFVYGALPVLEEPYLLNYGEGLSLLAANQVLEGKPLWQDVNRPPYFYFSYPPVFPYVSAGFVALLGNRLFAIRLLVVLCEVLLAWQTYRLLRRAALPRPEAALFAALLLGLLAVNRFHALARVDMLQVVLTLWAIEHLLAFLASGRRRHLPLAVLAFVLSALTKPTTLLAIGALGLHAAGLFFRPPARRQAWLLGATAAASVLVYALLVGLLDRWSGGEFYRQTYTYQALSGFWWKHVILAEFLRKYWPVLLAGLAGLAAMRGHGLLRLLATVSVVWFVISCHKQGADQNYSLEPLVFLTLAIGLAAHDLVRRLGRRRRRRTNPLPLRLLPFATAALVAALPLACGPELKAELGAPAGRDREELNRLMAETDGLTLSEEPFFAAYNRKPLWANDPYQLLHLGRHGVFDVRPLLRALHEGRFKRVFISVRLYNLPRVPEILARRFRMVFETEGTLLGSAWGVFDYTGEPGDARQ